MNLISYPPKKIFPLSFRSRTTYNPHTMGLVKPYVVRDSEFAELASNLSSYVDIATKSRDFSAKYGEIEEPLEEFYTAVLDSVSQLSGLPDKELEACLNVVFYLILEPLFEESPEKTAEEVFTKRFEVLLSNTLLLSPTSNPAFNDKTLIRFTTILSILTVYFNLLDSSSPLRYKVLTSIIDIFEKLDLQLRSENAHLLMPFVEVSEDSSLFVYEQFLVECGFESKIVSFAASLAKLLGLVYPGEALVVLKSACLKYLPGSAEVLQLVENALGNPQELDLSYLLNLEHVQLSPLYSLLSLYTGDSLADFSQKAKAQNTIESSVLIAKKEYLILAGLALAAAEKGTYESAEVADPEKVQKVTNFGPIITYKQISDELGFADDLVKIESLLINARGLGVLEGKIDQLKQVFCIQKLNLVVVPKSPENKLGQEEWKFILNSLKRWKKGISEAAGIVEQQRKKV